MTREGSRNPSTNFDSHMLNCGVVQIIETCCAVGDYYNSQPPQDEASYLPLRAS
jgi:hypothetical protein